MGNAAGPDWGQRGTAGAVIASELTLDHVSRRYPGGAEAVRDVSLRVKPGEILCLVGPSGCGKTTLLRLCSGIERPSSGRILLDGREISGPAGHVPPERRGIGLMFQDYALFPHLSIVDNVRFGLKPLPEREQVELARRALARVGMLHHERDYPHMLSGGEQQRVALARALAPRPGILLMDEPFSNLDGRMRDEVRDGAISILRETRATSIIVTHDPEEAMRVADRIVLMNRGAIVQAGTGAELYRTPQSLFAARFFCELNEIPGLARAGSVETPVGRFPIGAAHADGTKLVLCVRPRGVGFGAKGEGPAGRVLSRRFVGEVDLYDIAVEGLDQPLRARVRTLGAADAPTPGQDVFVRFQPDDVLVFAASGA